MKRTVITVNTVEDEHPRKTAEVGVPRGRDGETTMRGKTIDASSMRAPFLLSVLLLATVVHGARGQVAFADLGAISEVDRDQLPCPFYPMGDRRRGVFTTEIAELDFVRANTFSSRRR